MSKRSDFYLVAWWSADENDDHFQLFTSYSAASKFYRDRVAEHSSDDYGDHVILCRTLLEHNP